MDPILQSYIVAGTRLEKLFRLLQILFVAGLKTHGVMIMKDKAWILREGDRFFDIALTALFMR
jgi:hypothetical protein